MMNYDEHDDKYKDKHDAEMMIQLINDDDMDDEHDHTHDE